MIEDLKKWLLDRQEETNKVLVDEPTTLKESWNEGYDTALIDVYNQITELEKIGVK